VDGAAAEAGRRCRLERLGRADHGSRIAKIAPRVQRRTPATRNHIDALFEGRLK